jgi:hypothetical protein
MKLFHLGRKKASRINSKLKLRLHKCRLSRKPKQFNLMALPRVEWMATQ